MKEVIDAIGGRIKNPVFGYYILAFLAYNWKELFYLFASDRDVIQRFEYFDINTNVNSLLIKPLLIAIIGAITYPWINLFFVWIIKRPIEYKQIIHLTSKSRMLIKEKELEESRTKLLATKESELIRRAKTDEEIQSIADQNLRVQLQEEIESLRNQINEKITSSSPDRNASNNTTGLKDLYAQLASLYEKTGDIGAARNILEEAIHRFR